jgi:hypothetical protein
MGIIGTVSLMKMDMHDSEPHLQPLEDIEQCVKRGGELTQQLLGVAKRGRYNVKTVDTNKIGGDTAQMFGRTHKNIKIHQNFMTA